MISNFCDSAPDGTHGDVQRIPRAVSLEESCENDKPWYAEPQVLDCRNMETRIEGPIRYVTDDTEEKQKMARGGRRRIKAKTKLRSLKDRIEKEYAEHRPSLIIDWNKLIQGVPIVSPISSPEVKSKTSMGQINESVLVTPSQSFAESSVLANRSYPAYHTDETPNASNVSDLEVNITEHQIINNPPDIELTNHSLTLHRAISKQAPVKVISCLLNLNPISAIVPVTLSPSQPKKTALQRAIECKCSLETLREISQVSSRVKRDEVKFINNKRRVVRSDDLHNTKQQLSYGEKQDQTSAEDASQSSRSTGKVHIIADELQASKKDASSCSPQTLVKTIPNLTSPISPPSLLKKFNDMNIDEAALKCSMVSSDIQEELNNLKKLSFFIYRNQKKNVSDYNKIRESVLAQLTSEQEETHSLLQRRTIKSLRRMEVQSAQTLHTTLLQQISSVRKWLEQDCCSPIQQQVDLIESSVKNALQSVDLHLTRLGSDARRTHRDADLMIDRLTRRVQELEDQLDKIMSWQVDVVRRLACASNKRENFSIPQTFGELELRLSKHLTDSTITEFQETWHDGWTSFSSGETSGNERDNFPQFFDGGWDFFAVENDLDDPLNFDMAMLRQENCLGLTMSSDSSSSLTYSKSSTSCYSLKFINLRPPKRVRHLALGISDCIESCVSFIRLRRDGFRKVYA